MRIFTLYGKAAETRRFLPGALLLAPVCLLGLVGVTALTGCGSSSSDDVLSVPVNTLTISPTSATVVTGGTQTFSASGTTNGVTWSVQEGSEGGTITAAGIYTAPATAGTYHVVATSNSLPQYTATATVTVSSSTSQVVGISLSPATSSLTYGATALFSATVANTTNTNVNWTIQEGSAGGTITSTGVYTAPSTAGTYHVIATSVADPTKSATATVTVTAPSVVLITLNPTSATLVTGGSQTFTATVTNASNTGVTWSVQEGTSGGTVTSAGVYTAPSTAGTYHVVATSAADTSKTATATITVRAAATETGSGSVIVN